MHETITAFIQHLELEGRHETIRGYSTGLKLFDAWLDDRDPLEVTTDDLRAFQRWLSEEYRAADGTTLAKTTQATCLASVKSFYRWLTQRGMILVDVSRKLKLPKTPKRSVQKDHVTLQEATALLQTQARIVQTLKECSGRWARAYRNLALIALALATGRRRLGLKSVRLDELNFKRNELRVEREKGRLGRVVPVAAWTMAIIKTFVAKARPRLLRGRQLPWLFPGERSERLGNQTIVAILHQAQAATVEQNPDLDELAHKHLTPHSLRVSFAKLLFNGGCNIRSINELMLHTRLSTTARYTPIPLEELRRAMQRLHPRP